MTLSQEEIDINNQIGDIGRLKDAELEKAKPNQTILDDLDAQSAALKQARELIRHPIIIPDPPDPKTAEELEYEDLLVKIDAEDVSIKNGVLRRYLKLDRKYRTGF